MPKPKLSIKKFKALVKRVNEECAMPKVKSKIEKDYLDRFKEVADELGIEHNIAKRLANFIHVEVMTAKRKQLSYLNEVLEKVAKKHEVWCRTFNGKNFECNCGADKHNACIDNIRSSINA